VPLLSNVYSIGYHSGGLARRRPWSADCGTAERCAVLLGVDLATVRELAANVEPYIRAHGARVWSLMQLERQLRPEAFDRRRAATSTVDRPAR
jgi:methionyl-tRNA synthetase